MSFDLRSPSSQGSDVHSTDTPRTRDLKELRQRRLAYFDTNSENSERKAVSSPRPPSHPRARGGRDSPRTQGGGKKRSEGGQNTAVSASSPRPRRSLFRPRSSSTNSDERSPRSQNSSLDRAQVRDSRLIDLRLDITPRARLGSGSSSTQDLRIMDAPHAQNNPGSHRSNALRDSFGSLFSDIGSDFTDVTNTDILLSDNFAEEPCSVIKRKKDSSRSKSDKTDNHKVSNNSNSSKGIGTKENLKTKTSPKEHFENGIGSGGLSMNGHQSHDGFRGDGNVRRMNPQRTESSVASSRSDEDGVSLLSETDRKGVENGFGRAVNGLPAEQSVGNLISLDSPSRSTISGHNTSLWSDKSTGERTLSHDLVSHDLLPDIGVNRGQQAQLEKQDDLPPASGVKRGQLESGEIRDLVSTEINSQDLAWRAESPVIPTYTPEAGIPRLDTKPPVNTLSQQFHTSSSTLHNSESTSPDKQNSLNAENLNLANLSAVLGEDRLRRLLMNFQESEDYSDLQSEVTSVSKVNRGESGGNDLHPLDKVNIWASLSDTGNVEPEEDRMDRRCEKLTSGQMVGLGEEDMGSNLNSKQPGGLDKEIGHEGRERDSVDIQETRNLQMNGFNRNAMSSDLTNSMVYANRTNPLADSSVGLAFPQLETLEDEKSVVEELGLQTHRPEETERQGHMIPVYASQDRKWAVNQSDEPANAACTVKYSYSVEQIYARANSVTYSGEQSQDETSTSPKVVSRLNVTLAQGQEEKKDKVDAEKNRDQSSGRHGDGQKRSQKDEVHSRPPRGPLTKSYHGNETGEWSSADRKLAWSMDETGGDEGGRGRGHRAEEKGQGDGILPTQGGRTDSAPFSSGPAHSSKSPAHSTKSPAHSSKSSKPPMPASIERYFQSIEQVSHVSSVCSDTFEPVPEPDIQVTPRDPLQVQGKEMHLGDPSVSPVKDNGPSPRSFTQKNSPKRPSLNSSTSEKKVSQSAQAPPLQEVNDDQLYDLVQSALSEIDTARSGAVTQKLQQLGIDFEFLRESYESHKASQSQRGGEGVPPPAPDVSSTQCPACLTQHPGGTPPPTVCTLCGGELAPTPKPTATAPTQSTHSPRVSNHLPHTRQPSAQNNNRISKESSKSSRVSESLRSLNLSLNLRSSANSVDSSATASVTGKEAGPSAPIGRARQKRVQRLRERGGGGDAESSISLDYSEKFDNPRESISQILKAELSIDVRGSSDSSLLQSSKGRGKTRESQVEDIRVRDDSETNSVQNEAVAMETGEQEMGEGEPAGDEGDRAGVSVISSTYEEFLHRLISDPRLRNRPQPARSQGKPATAANRRSHQYAGVQSKVRSSWDNKEVPARRWEKSNLAWSSHNLRDVSKSLLSRSAVVGGGRPSSAGKNREGGNTSPRQQRKPRPQSADISGRRSLPHHDCGTQQDGHHFEPQNSHRGTGPILSVQSAVCGKGKDVRESRNTRLNNYKKYLALAQGYTGKLYSVEESDGEGRRDGLTFTEAAMMSPRVHSGEVSFLQCLPDEILLHILSHLKHRDLARCLSVCHHLNRVASDDSLWREVTIRKCSSLTDQSLAEIGRRRPHSLSLIQCHGNKVTAHGLRELFRQSADSLKSLCVSGCTRGPLSADHLVLHASARCPHISTLDVSWCNLNDNGLVAAAEAFDRLSSLSVSGCQQISDDALNAVVVKHGIYLHTLELFGCFNLTSRGLASLANHCKSLTTLNLGQCWKLTDSCISNLAPTLSAVQNLDLRGCKQIKDQTVHQVVKNCPHLRTLSLANCVNISDAAMAEIATYCPDIQSLDVCGCKLVTNQGVRSLAHSCHVINFLDLSSTAITSKSVSTLSSYSSVHLEVLKLNFCKQISTQCLARLAKNAKNLHKLYLYGVRGLGSLEDVKRENTALLIETDQIKPV